MQLIRTLFIIFTCVMVPYGTLWAQVSSDDRRAMDEDVKELEALISGETPSETKRAPARLDHPKGFYRSFGKDVAIRGDGKFIYIKVGPTSIVIDKKGRVQIKAAKNLFLQSKKSIFLQADENINLIAGGEVIQSKLRPVRSRFDEETYKQPKRYDSKPLSERFGTGEEKRRPSSEDRYERYEHRDRRDREEDRYQERYNRTPQHAPGFQRRKEREERQETFQERTFKSSDPSEDSSVEEVPVGADE